MKRWQADACLLLAALIWGTAFVAQKDANDKMGAVLFVGIRFSLSALVLLPLAWNEARRSRHPLAARDVRLAFAIGCCLAFGAVMQQVAMLSISATNAGFITALYIALVPFFGWAITGARIRPVILLAVALCIGGAWLLAAEGSAAPMSIGDGLVALSDLLWAAHITLVGIFLARAHRPFFLACLQCSCTAALGLAAGVATESVIASGIWAAVPALLFAGLVSGGIAYTLQLVAQRYTPATEAAIILSLESVFAALSAALLLGERLTVAGIAGCALILGGVLLVRPEEAEVI